MVRLLITRLIQAIPILIVVVVVTFFLLRVGGGDPSNAILGVGGTPAQHEIIRERLGLNLPLWQQFGTYLLSLLRGDLGVSLVDGTSVIEEIATDLPVTLSLTFGAVLLALVIGIPVGTIAAIRGPATDRAIQSGSLVGFALPSFWLALVLIAVFGATLHLLPVAGYTDFADDPVDWFLHLVLPVFALSLTGLAAIVLQTRAAVRDAMARDYIRMLRSTGVSQASLVIRHALRGGAATIVGVTGLQFIGLFGAALFIEQVFALPGVGRLAVTAASKSDFTVLQGLVIITAVVVIAVNIIVDLAIYWLTPRVRTA